MGRYHEKTSGFFARLTSGLGRKQRPVVIPLSKSLGSPAPQTSLSTSSYQSLGSKTDPSHPFFAVFELPDELLLSILSYISPDPRLIGHYARFRVEYILEINDHHQQRVQFLRPLSITCKAMWLRLLPWIWERLEASRRNLGTSGDFEWKLNAIVSALHADAFVATSVKYFCALLRSLGSGLISGPLKIHDGPSPVEWSQHPSFLCQMPRVPPKPPHTRDRIRGRDYYDPA